MVTFRIKRLELEVFDPENQRHKIFDLQRPMSDTDIYDIWERVVPLVSKLGWLPNERIAIDTTQFKKLPVEYE